MFRSLVLIAVLSCATCAYASGNLNTTIQTWQQLRDKNAVTIDFANGYNFLTNYPGWPEEKIIRLRTEAAAMRERPDTATLAKFCTYFPPISGRGMIACLRVGADDAASKASTLKQAWVQGDFTEDEEERILAAYEEQLSPSDHLARMERLLYEGKSAPAKRMLQRTPAPEQNSFRVRIAFINDEPNAPRLLHTLSAKQLAHPGIIFERVRYRMKHDSDHLGDLLVKVPKDAPYPNLWWPMRALAAREAMQRDNDELALAIIQHHGELKPDAMAEALWLKGWILLRHRGEAGAAYKQFFALYTTVSTPVSKARAAYWAARAAEANDNPDIAKEWLEKAARHPTVFYGQLALSKLNPGAALVLPKATKPSAEEKQAFQNDVLVKATRLVAASGDEETRDMFLTALSMKATSAGQFALIAELAQEIGGTAMGVEAAKLALREGVVLINEGWPRIKLPPDLPIEPALTLAITRQESQFNPKAKSSANARGLMQLLPSTAKQVAKRAGIPYHISMLEDPSSNLILGSRYLGQRIDAFDGSYILGIASYNAGIGNVRKWVTAYGIPQRKRDAAIDWIESIPFGETRNYVMRVLENISVYRALESPDTPLMIEKDLVR